LQQAARTGKYDLYQKYAKLINEQDKKHFTLRGLLDFKPQTAISIDEVEPIENILKRALLN
jgi:glutamate synthase (ferredoxin)